MDNEKTMLPLLPKEEEEKAIEVRSHTALNDLGRTDSRKQGVQAIELNPGTLYGSAKAQRAAILTGQTQLIFEQPEAEVRIAASTDIVLTYLISTIRKEDLFDKDERKIARAEGSLTSYMELRGLKDRKESRKQVTREIQALQQVTITFTGEDAFVGIPLAGDKGGVVRDNIFFSFSPTFKRSILQSDRAFTLLLDERVFRINTNDNPHSWHIHKKLINHYSANMGKPNEYRLSVQALLDYVTSIPKPEDVPRKETERIIAPMERDLNALVDLGVLDYWDYCRTNGEPLTDEEQAARLDDEGNDKVLPYRLAKDALITWKFANEYNREKRLEAKEATRQKRIEAKTAREERSKRVQKKAERIAAQKLAEEMLKEGRNDG